VVGELLLLGPQLVDLGADFGLLEVRHVTSLEGLDFFLRLGDFSIVDCEPGIEELSVGVHGWSCRKKGCYQKTS